MLFGVRGGTPLTNSNGLAGGLLDRFGAGSFNHRYEIGPTVGVRLPFGFSVEGDALYGRQTLSLGQFAGITAADTHTDSWQFPVMFKYTGGRRVVSPVVGAGVTVRHLNNFSTVPAFLFNGSTSPNTVGFVAGGGLRLRMGPVDITPELRYTRWNGNTLASALGGFFPLGQNEASVLVGFTF